MSLNEILRRRRAIMGAQGGASDVLYELKNHAVATGDVIDSGVQFYSAGFAGTVLLDVDIEINQTSSSSLSATLKFICVEDSSGQSATGFSLWIGKGNRNAASYACSVTGSVASGIGIETGIARYKIAVTHDANSNIVNVRANKNGGEVSATTHTHGYTASTETLTFGLDNGAQHLPQGTIHIAKVYNRILSADEINAFFA